MKKIYKISKNNPLLNKFRKNRILIIMKIYISKIKKKKTSFKQMIIKIKIII